MGTETWDLLNKRRHVKIVIGELQPHATLQSWSLVSAANDEECKVLFWWGTTCKHANVVTLTWGVNAWDIS